MNRAASIVTIAVVFAVVVLIAVFYATGRTDLVAGTHFALGLTVATLMVLRIVRRDRWSTIDQRELTGSAEPRREHPRP